MSRFGIGYFLASFLCLAALNSQFTFAQDAFDKLKAQNPDFPGPRGADGKANPANSGAGVAGAGNNAAGNSAAGNERKAYQDLREQVLSALEKKYDVSAAATVKQMLETPPPAPPTEPAPQPVAPEAVTKAVTAFNAAAKELVDLKTLIDGPPAARPEVAKIHDVITKFDAALKVVQDLKLTQPDQLAIELLKLSINTIDTSGLRPANILPALMKNLMVQLKLTGIFADAVPQAAIPGEVPNPAPTLSPTQFVFDRLLKENDLHSEVAKLKSDTTKPVK